MKILSTEWLYVQITKQLIELSNNEGFLIVVVESPVNIVFFLM